MLIVNRDSCRVGYGPSDSLSEPLFPMHVH